MITIMTKCNNRVASKLYGTRDAIIVGKDVLRAASSRQGVVGQTKPKSTFH